MARIKAINDESFKAGGSSRAELAAMKEKRGFVKAAFEEEAKLEDALVKQRIANNNLIRGTVRTGTAEEIKATQKDLAELTRLRKRYAKDTQEYQVYTEDIIKKEQELKDLRTAAINKASGNEPVIVKNKAYYEEIIKDNTEKLNDIDLGLKDFETRAAPLKKKIADAEKSLLNFKVADPRKQQRDQQESFNIDTRYNEILRKAYELNEKYNNRSLTDDEQKLANIRNEFKALQADIDEYNSNPKNKRKYNTDIKPALEKALQAQEYTSETEKLRADLEKQKALYREYEDYKSKLGQEAADARYSKDLNVFSSHLEQLQQRESELLSKGFDNLNVNEKSRLKVFQDGIKSEIAIQQQKQDELLKEFAGYAQLRQAAEERYQADLISIGDNPKAKEKRKIAYDKEVADMDAANMTKLQSYEKMFEGIGSLSKHSAERVLKTARTAFDKEVAAGKIKSEAEIDAINALFDKMFAGIEKGTGTELVELANQLDEVARSISGISDEFGEVLSSVSNVIGQVGNLKQSLDKINSNNLSPFEKITAGLGAFSAGASIVGSAISLISTASDLLNFKDKRLSKQIENHQRQLNGLAQSYKELERDIENSVGEKIFAEQTKQIELLNAEYQLLSQMLDAERAKRNADKSKIDEYIQQLEEIPEKIEDIKKAIDESLIQTNFRVVSDNIADALTDAFGKGADAANNFDKVLDNVMINATKNSLKLKYLEPVIARFTEDLTDFAKVNNGDFSGFNFDSWKFIIGQAADQVNAGLEAVKQYFPEIEVPIELAPNYNDIATPCLGKPIKKIYPGLTQYLNKL